VGAPGDGVDPVVRHHGELEEPPVDPGQLDRRRDLEPRGRGGLVEMSTWMPRVISAGQSRCWFTSWMQVHSINPTRKPVARTWGMARKSGDSGYRCGTVLSGGTR